MNADGFAFAFPHHWQWLFVLVVILALFIRSERVRRQLLSLLRFPSHIRIRSLAPRGRQLKFLLYAFGVICVVIALMGPQWGQKEIPLKAQGLDICLALDLSPSMLAEDVRPSRLDAVKNQLLVFLPRLGGDQVALVPFAGSSYVAAPLTIDYASLLSFIEPLQPSFISDPSTYLGSGLQNCLTVFGLKEVQERDPSDTTAKVIAMVSDGEDTSGDELTSLVTQLKQLGIPVFTFAIGTEQGAPVPVRNSQGQIQGYIQDPKTGQAAVSQVHRESLLKISQDTGAKSYVLNEGIDSWLAFESDLQRFKRESRDAGTRLSLEHRFQIPLIIGILVLMLDFLLSETLRIRRSAVSAKVPSPPSSRPVTQGLSSFFLLMVAIFGSKPALAMIYPTHDDLRVVYQTRRGVEAMIQKQKSHGEKLITEALEKDSSHLLLRWNWASSQLLGSVEEITNSEGQPEAKVHVEKAQVAAKEFEALLQIHAVQNDGALEKLCHFQLAIAKELIQDFPLAFHHYYQALQVGPQDLDHGIRENIIRLLVAQDAQGQGKGQGQGGGQGQNDEQDEFNKEYQQRGNHKPKYQGTDLSEQQAQQILQSVDSEGRDVQQRNAQGKSRRNSNNEKGQSSQRGGRPW